MTTNSQHSQNTLGTNHRRKQTQLSAKGKFGLIMAAIVVILVGFGVFVACRMEPPLPPLHINLQQPILDEPTATVDQAQKWARSRDASETFVE
ncbi:MAG TPA: hypothetical protein GX717_02210, partial [Clostridiaceae bacterium]|nr:hypothetical protein [Clostridiaceae bacterium]